jgi:RNA polymerase sigma-70 factor (ECF subfamily)
MALTEGSLRLTESTVVRARRGDREAYEQLARDAAQRLYPIAYRIVRDRDLADEAVQRTLVAIWRELPKLREVSKFDAWSYRLLVRFCSAELRGRRMRTDVTEVQIPAAGNRHDDLVDRDELERGFRRLSAEQKAVIVLTYYGGLSGQEVANALDISPGTVASRLHYGLRTLRAAIEADSRNPVRTEGQK